MKFDDINLDDATLQKVELSWSEKNFEISGLIFGAHSSKFKLGFRSVVEINIPHKEEWGSSNSIYELSASGKNEFEIQIQPGDTICVEAKEFYFEKDI